MRLDALAAMLTRLLEQLGLQRPTGARYRLTPRVRSLVGALRGAMVDEEDYLQHLEAKCR